MATINIKEKYQKEILKQLKHDFSFKNVLSIPKLEKVTLNVGLGKSITNKDYLKVVEDTIRRITGQHPIFTKAKKSISSFKIREGMIVGAKVTLRGKRMYDFLDKLINITFPRVKDFRGIDVSGEKHFDKHGNFSYGFREHVVFPEIKADEVENIHGLEITVSTTAKNPGQCYFLLKYIGFPFVIDEKNEEVLKEKYIDKKNK
jgi:large subunit ribosomal protein L5